MLAKPYGNTFATERCMKIRKDYLAYLTARILVKRTHPEILHLKNKKPICDGKY